MRLGGRAGMTLLELLVGLTITGLVLAAGYAALASVADHRQRAAAAADEVARAAAVRRTLTAWLAGARLEAYQGGPEFRGVDGTDGGHDDDELSFLTAVPIGARAFPTVRLYVDRDEKTPERGLVAELGDWRRPETERVVLMPEATDLEVRYLSGISAERVWLPSWISGTVLPRALEMRVSAVGTDTLPPLFRVPLTVALGEAR
ncbi:MAG TPA: prepilin-type N-terminal cleavage/methylation domain-containing protein [Longimicrobium sp.]|nr:prepilin-type N-terminal cleavage/methylation domain-containing protein [Longimicrobium sp.]